MSSLREKRRTTASNSCWCRVAVALHAAAALVLPSLLGAQVPIDSVRRPGERNDPATPLAAQARAIAAAYGVTPYGYYEDADYLKLRELALAFDVPDRVAAAVGAHNATIVLGGRNLGTWTKYSGADPEAGSYGTSPIGVPTIIADFGTVPTARAWTLRVRLSY